jgi:hypothetical protein
VVELGDATLLPGLMNMHIHLISNLVRPGSASPCTKPRRNGPYWRHAMRGARC